MRTMGDWIQTLAHIEFMMCYNCKGYDVGTNDDNKTENDHTWTMLRENRDAAMTTIEFYNKTVAFALTICFHIYDRFNITVERKQLRRIVYSSLIWSAVRETATAKYDSIEMNQSDHEEMSRIYGYRTALYFLG